MDMISLALSKANLPDLPGTNQIEQLVAGRDMAAAALRQYVPGLQYDANKAAQALSSVEAWAMRNHDRLAQQLSSLSSADKVPAEMQLELGVATAQSYVLACFTQASVGIGPHVSGIVDQEIARNATIQGTVISGRWRDVDIETRKQVFQSIIKMEQDGSLRNLFVPPADAAAGLGLAPLAIVAIALVVLIVSLVSIFLIYQLANKTMQTGNDILREMCDKAKQSGDANQIQRCMDLASDLARNPFGVPYDKILSAATWVGVTYVGVRWGLPIIMQGLGRKGSVPS